MRLRHPGDQIDYSAFPILKLLGHAGPMRLSALANDLQLDASTVSRHARQLEDRGLLLRTDDPDDGRASRVAVSDQGAACLEQGFASRRAMITAALDGWTQEERDTLRDLLHRLVRDLPDPDTQENS
jgi:DNA-binding MarR family transcriptional regulator